MKYLFVLLVAITALTSVRAKIPSDFKTCSRNDPQLSECIENSINGLRDKLRVGMPDLGVPAFRLLEFKKVNLDLGQGFKAEIRNLEVEGLSEFVVNAVFADIIAQEFFFNVSIPQVVARGHYSVDAALGGIPLQGSGRIDFSATSIVGAGTLHGKKLTRGGKTLFYFPSMELKLDIGDYKINLENLFDGDPAIGEVTNKLLNEEKTEVLPGLLPGLEKAVVEKILFIANNICKHFTWNELFPES